MEKLNFVNTFILVHLAHKGVSVDTWVCMCMHVYVCMHVCKCAHNIRCAHMHYVFVGCCLVAIVFICYQRDVGDHRVGK